MPKLSSDLQAALDKRAELRPTWGAIGYPHWPPDDYTGPAQWSSAEHDEVVAITGRAGEESGVRYFYTAEGSGALPETQLRPLAPADALAEYEAAIDALTGTRGLDLARAAWRVAWAGIRAQVDYMTGRVGKCDAGKWRAWAWGYSGALAETLGRAAEIIGGESVMASPLAGAQFGEVVAVHAERPKVRAQPEPADVDAAYWQFVMGSEGEARVLGDGVQ